MQMSPYAVVPASMQRPMASSNSFCVAYLEFKPSCPPCGDPYTSSYASQCSSTARPSRLQTQHPFSAPQSTRTRTYSQLSPPGYGATRCTTGRNFFPERKRSESPTLTTAQPLHGSTERHSCVSWMNVYRPRASQKRSETADVGMGAEACVGVFG